MTTSGPTGAATSSLIARRDLQFLLHEWLQVERLFEREPFADHSREIVDDVLGLAERVATDHFAPHNRAADENEPHIDDDGRVVLVDGVEQAVKAFFETGLAGASMDESVGGMSLPYVVSTAAHAYFSAANAATAGYGMLTVAAANLLVANGSREQVERFVMPMLEGRSTGTMCLSETQAGSSLGDIATRAVPQDDGGYRLFGTKMWISGGDHELSENIVHLVLAKIPGGPAGVKGISLFIVPRFLVDDDGELGERNDVVLAGLNHKMGFRGTVNTVLGFGEGEHRPGGSPGAVGYLVGEPDHGLRYMFSMMNEARIGVGLGAVTLGYTGYLKSLKYAKERPQGRSVADRDPASPQVPIIEHPDVRRMLLAQKSYVEGGLALVLYCAQLFDDHRTLPEQEDRDSAHLLLEVLTPVVKSWPSQWCLEANSLAIQVHGGYGYARDYEVEQHYRDNRLNPIHEGTHGIQGLDLLGRKVPMQGGRGLALLAETIRASVARAGGADPELAAYADQLNTRLERLVEVTGLLYAAGIDVALANATVYLEATGHIVMAWIWLEQLLAVGGKAGEFYDGKRAAGRFFFLHELPRTGPQLDLLATADRTVLDVDPMCL